MQNSPEKSVRFLHHARGEQYTLILGCMNTQEFWSHIRNVLNDHNMQNDISYLNISFGILNSNNMKNEMINVIILLAKYFIYTSKYKQQKKFKGFKNYFSKEKK